MGAVVRVDAGGREAEALDGFSADEVLPDDFFGVARMRKAIPDLLRVHDEDGGVLALVETTGLVDTNFVLQTSGLDGILERAAKLLSVLIGATGAGGGGVAIIYTNKKMVLVVRH
jgi:hypothetical protein